MCHGLDARGVIGHPVAHAVKRELTERWLERFCANLHRATGKWVHRGLRWHAYSYGFEHALTRDAALAAYAARAAPAVFVYFEEEDELFDCVGVPSPRFDDWHHDLYVFPADLAWTMVFTHEHAIGFGPYFAEAPSATDDD